MKSLKELDDANVGAAFFAEALAQTQQLVANGTANVGRGSNSGVLGHDGDAAANVDAWFDSAAWHE